MKKLLLFAFVLAASLHVVAGKAEFQTGKLLDVDSDERLAEGTTIRRAIYQVQIGDIIYFARGERLRKRSGEPGHGLVIGDPVEVAIDGENLLLKRPDGKEIKAKIIKRARAHN